MNDLFSIQELKIFQAVAECGGVNRAAARLNRVQSNVTTRLKQLEARLGARLFHRQKRRLVLSAEGKVLLGYAERLLHLAAEAHGALQGGALRGVLRLGALESTAATRLPAVLARYHSAYPEVSIELATGTSGALVERVRAGELEAAFVAEPFALEGLDTLHVFTEELVLIGPMGWSGKAAELPVLAFASGCAYRRRLEAWLGGSGIPPGRVMEYGSYHAIVACAAAGSGTAIVPRSILDTLKLDAPLSVHRLPGHVAKAKTRLVWREGQHSSALAALKRVVQDSARGTPARSPARSRRVSN